MIFVFLAQSGGQRVISNFCTITGQSCDSSPFLVRHLVLSCGRFIHPGIKPFFPGDSYRFSQYILLTGAEKKLKESKYWQRNVARPALRKPDLQKNAQVVKVVNFSCTDWLSYLRMNLVEGVCGQSLFLSTWVLKPRANKLLIK